MSTAAERFMRCGTCRRRALEPFYCEDMAFDGKGYKGVFKDVALERCVHCSGEYLDEAACVWIGAALREPAEILPRRQSGPAARPSG